MANSPNFPAHAGTEGFDSTVIVGTLAAAVLAAAAVGALGLAVGNWPLGLTLGALILAGQALAMGFLTLRARRQAERLAGVTWPAVLDAVAGPVVVTDREGGVLAQNRAFREAFGARISRLDEIVTADHASEEALASAPGAVVKARFHTTTLAVGTKAWEMTGKADDEQTIWTFAEAERTRPGRLLQEIAADLAPILQHFELAFVLTDGEGRISYLSPLAAKWSGRAKGDALDELLSPDGSRLYATGSRKIAVRSATHTLGFGEDRIVVIKRTDSAPAAAFSARNGEPTAALFDNAPLGVAMLSKKGKIVDFNNTFADFLPDGDVAAGIVFCDLLAPDSRDEIAAAIADSSAGSPPPAAIEARFGSDSGRIAQIYFSGSGDGSGGVVLHLIDVTEQKSLEIRFVQGQKMQAVGQLAGGVAHDFNNLLTAIIGFCDLLLMRHSAGDDSFSDIMQIKQNANRAANLVRQLLAFSRQQTLRPEVHSVTDILAELSNLLGRLIGATIELKIAHGRDVGAVKVDQGQLEQVIINLAVNARDAMPDGGELTIRTAKFDPDEVRQLGQSVMPPADYTLIEVSDTGTGIEPEHLDKIFEPFFTTKEVGKGTGLGLSTCYGIIKQTGGFIFADSEVGTGTRFTIYLPVHKATAEDEKPAEAQPKDLTGKGTILVVEDEDAVRMFACRALRNKGYTVLEASSGEDALAQINDGLDLDLLVSDIIMPNMDGPSLVKEVLKQKPDLSVIFISGYAEDTFRRDLEHRNAGFLPKPFTLKQLAEKVKEALAA